MKRIELVKIGSWIFKNRDKECFGKLASVLVGYAWMLITDYTKENFDPTIEFDVNVIFADSPDILVVIQFVQDRMNSEAIQLSISTKKTEFRNNKGARK